MRQRGFEPLIISVPDSSKLFGFHKALMLADIDSWNFSWIFFGCFAPLCLLCGALALIDIQRGIIPNRLNLSIAGLGLLKAAVGGGVFAALEAGCTAPVGALGEVAEGDDGTLELFLRGSVTAIDGANQVVIPYDAIGRIEINPARAGQENLYPCMG